MILAGRCAAAVLVAASGPALPQDAERGRTEYLERCAGCHGSDAKGGGPQRDKLKTKPIDLTVLAKRNHGTFDAAAVYQMIDGRNVRTSRHSTEMPIWGCRHKAPALPPAPTASKHRKLPNRVFSARKKREDELDSLLDLPCGSEDAIRERILSIVDYLGALQVK